MILAFHVGLIIGALFSKRIKNRVSVSVYYFQKILAALKTSNSKISNPKNWDYRIQPIFILFCVLAQKSMAICKHFDPTVDAEGRYYEEIYNKGWWLQRVYDLNQTNPNDSIIQAIVNSSCIGDSITLYT